MRTATSKRVFSSDTFLTGQNANYIDAMYAQWQKDPSSVHASWSAYFSGENFKTAPTLGKSPHQSKIDEIISLLKSGAVATGDSSGVNTDRQAKEAVNLAALLQSYESVGHLVADIDPLRLKEVYKDSKTYAQKFRFPQAELLKLLDYKEYGFTEADLEREFFIEIGHKSSILAKKKVWKLKDVIEAYKTAYCGKVGVEFSHIPDREICDWIRVNFEGIQYNRMTDAEKIHLYDRLNWSHDFGQFIGQKFNTMKRFGLEGCESFIPGLKVAIDAAVDNGARTFIIGMPHRGRLNVLTNVVRKPLEVIMAEF